MGERSSCPLTTPRVARGVQVTLLAQFLFQGGTLGGIPSYLTDSPQPPMPVRLTYPIKAPWPAGVVWYAGGDNKGSFYEDCDPRSGKWHCDFSNGARDRYAIDFNGITSLGNAGEIDDEGVLVLAVEDAVVKEVGRDKNYGWYVVLGHALGYESRYAHLREEPLVKARDWLAQGTPLGYVGSTGKSTRDHLHFAMYYCDPRYLLTPTPFGSESECDKPENRYAQLPEPIEGIEALTDGQQITSTNYGVGFEEMALADITDRSRLRFHEPFLKTYELFGRIVFGLSESPIRTWDGTTYRYQTFGSTSSNYPFPWAGSQAALFENGPIAYLILGQSWDWYRSRSGPSSSLGLPVTHTYHWTEANLGLLSREGFRNDFVGGSVIWFPGGDARILDRGNAGWDTRP